MPRVSIIIRTKDRPAMLARAVEDILNQAYADWHVVIVNDGGDESALAPIIDAFHDRLGERYEVVSVSPPAGRAGAANRGLDHAVGEFLTLHDDDDLWHPLFLERTVEQLDTAPDAVAVAVPTDIVVEQWENDRYVEVERRPFVPPGDIVSLHDLIHFNRVVPIGMLLRRDVVTRLGGWDASLLCVEDWELNLRLAAQGRIDYLRGEPLAFWMQRPSISDGPAANSMFSSADGHFEFDRLVRDRALRPGDPHHEIGHLLYLSRFIDERLRWTEDHLNASVESLRDELRRDVEYYSLGATARRQISRWRQRRRRR